MQNGIEREGRGASKRTLSFLMYNGLILLLRMHLSIPPPSLVFILIYTHTYIHLLSLPSYRNPMYSKSSLAQVHVCVKRRGGAGAGLTLWIKHRFDGAGDAGGFSVDDEFEAVA